MRVLALDLGSKSTGWAMLVDGVITSGVKHFTRKMGKNPEPRGKIIYDFDKWLSAILNLITFDLIVYEAPHFRGSAATFFGVGLQAIVEMECSNWLVPVMNEHTMTVKKFAAGAAKISEGKSQTIARAQQWNPAITSDDEADALCLLLYVLGQKNIPIPPHNEEEER